MDAITCVSGLKLISKHQTQAHTLLENWIILLCSSKRYHIFSFEASSRVHSNPGGMRGCDPTQ